MGTTILDAFITVNQISAKVIIELIIFSLLLMSSALISGSEVAFFSLTPQDIEDFKNSKSKKANIILSLLNQPDKLLATILISNNFVNIGIVILSTFISEALFNFSNELVKFIFEVIVVTFLILLFGEVIPKVYANTFNKAFAQFMAYPLFVLQKFFSPLSKILIKSSQFASKYVKPKEKLSLEDISKAIDLAEYEKNQKRLLKDIIKFGSVYVKEIMTPRVDVVALDYNWNFEKVKKTIAKYKFSRYPVFKDKLDNIVGILVIKKLIAHIYKTECQWQKTLIPPLFVPETMKIDDLFELFQKKKMHMAIVTDEFGGFSGIVTLEDVLEEIIGEITDEYDQKEAGYQQKSENIFVFDGKFLINDFYKVFGITEDILDKYKGDSETLAGLILELKGDFPKEGEKFKVENFEFEVAEVDERHIEKIIVKKLK